MCICMWGGAGVRKYIERRCLKKPEGGSKCPRAGDTGGWEIKSYLLANTQVSVGQGNKRQKKRKDGRKGTAYA